MTYREMYFSLQKRNNKYLNNTAIKSLLMDDGNFSDFPNLINHFNNEITNWARYSDCVKDLEPEAIILTKRHKTTYAIIEDENFDRFGWYEQGQKK